MMLRTFFLSLLLQSLISRVVYTAGIKKLHSAGLYESYFPLHSGPYKSEKLGVDYKENTRQVLFYEWSRPGAFWKEQPYDAIRSV